MDMSAFSECFLFYLFQVFALSVNVSECVYVYVVHILAYISAPVGQIRQCIRVMDVEEFVFSESFLYVPQLTR